MIEILKFDSSSLEKRSKFLSIISQKSFENLMPQSKNRRLTCMYI